MTRPRTRPLLALAAAALAGVPVAAAEPADHPRTYLASLTVALRPGERLTDFTIDTWGVRFRAVCRIPAGWRITAGGSAAPDGVLHGEASHGVTWLFAKDLTALRGVALVELYGPVQRRRLVQKDGYVPATFAGRATIDLGTGDDRAGHARLDYRNVRLSPAQRCPPAEDR